MTVELASTPNFRDLGGAVTRDGRMVRTGLVFRSEAVLDPTDADRAALAAIQIALVCDLRGNSERLHAPNRWWAGQGVELLDLDILADIRTAAIDWDGLRADPGVASARGIMLALYRELPVAAGRHLATILSRIAAGDLPMLIHCTAGKDRTGFMSAMILQALGVAEDAIVADYLASGSRINETVIAATRRLIVEKAGIVPEAAMAAITGVEADYIRTALATIRADHGSIETYLEQVGGLDPAKLAAVRERLLA